MAIKNHPHYLTKNWEVCPQTENQMGFAEQTMLLVENLTEGVGSYPGKMEIAMNLR